VSRIIAWFVHNPVAANLLMLTLVAGGLLALPAIHQEEFPSIETDVVRITVDYPGAAPAEVEESVCIRLEEAIEGTPDVDRISSVAAEGFCVVTVELVMGDGAAGALAEVQNRVEALDTLPDEAEAPVVGKFLITNRVMQVALAGPAPEASLKVLGQRARDEIAALPGVSQVNLGYTRPYEVSIEVSEETLRRHGLSLGEVAATVRRSSLDLPGGSVKTAGGEILLRTVGQAHRGDEFADVVVLTRRDGTSLRLGEIAQIVDGFADVDLRARWEGEPAVILTVERVGDEDMLEIAAAVKTWAAGFRPGLPEGVDLVLFNDASEDLEVRLDALLDNARSGILLVIAILALFLRFRLAMWVAAGVPTAFLGALMLFPGCGISISTLTVMSFILVLGILVDDAIVVGDSVYTHERNAEDQVQAAIRGTQEVATPVIFGVLTTVAAFLPLLLAPGRMGRFFSVIGLAAILCLVASLVESQLVLPAHLAHRRTRSKTGTPNAFVRRWTAFQEGIADAMERLAQVSYGGALRRAIEFRYVTAAAALGLVLVTVALFASGRMRYQFFPAVEGDVVFASLVLPRGTPLERSLESLDRLEASAAALRAEIDAETGEPSIFLHTVSSVGEKLARDGPPELAVQTGGSHLAEVALELVPSTQREISSSEVARRWRERTGVIPDAVELTFASEAFSAGSAIDIELRGGDTGMLIGAAAALRARLATYRGVQDIADSFRGGKQEVQLALRPEARPLGLTLQDLALQVRQAFHGEEVQRIQRGRDDLKVMVRYPAAERRSLGSLEAMRIRTADGAEVPFPAVARAELSRGFATIRRSDRQRTVNVTADVDRTLTTPEKVLADIQAELPALLADYPGTSFRLDGEQREHGSAVAGLIRGALLALLLIYALLAIPLRSYAQPLVIMSVIPFGAIGAILGHLVMGWDLVFFSVLGIVALSGVVVNASLVLVHSVNARRAEGHAVLEAVVRAGMLRFRPIVLTSLTTFIGLVPLMFEAAVPARPMIPMAISLGYGVLLTSLVTLFLVPCGYVILGDLAMAWARRAEAGAPDAARLAPAARAGDYSA